MMSFQYQLVRYVDEQQIYEMMLHRFQLHYVVRCLEPMLNAFQSFVNVT